MLYNKVISTHYNDIHNYNFLCDWSVIIRVAHEWATYGQDVFGCEF